VVSRPRATGYAAMAAALAVCAWLIASHDGGSGLKTVKIGPSAGATTPATPTGTGATPTTLSAAQLAARSRSVGHPVYWAGTISGMRYALTRDGTTTFVSYLPAASEDVALRVATIPYANAFAATKELAKKPGASSRILSNGSLVYYRSGRPATYVVFPDADYVVEVDAPSPARARQVALSGGIGPIG
jgi:hypothetical protein